jgi:hypothetical protein
LRNKRQPATEDGIPVVTYSRLPKGADPADEGRHELRDAEPWLDGVEVPLVERAARSRVPPEIRAEAYGDPPPEPLAADLFEPPRRTPRLLATLAVIAIVALLVAVGVLALTFHAATTVTAQAPASSTDPAAEITDLQKQLDALANATGPASEATKAKIAELESRLTDLEAAKAPDGSPAPALRTITTDGDAVTPPPPPRERPKKEVRAVPDAADKPPVKAVAAVSETAAPRVEAKVAAVPVARAKTGEGGSSGSDADFIASVEKALANARPDPKMPPASLQAKSAAIAPDGAVPPRTLAPAADEPAIATGVSPPARVNAAPAADAAPTDIGPAVRVIPDNGASADAGPVLLSPRGASPAAPAPAVLDVPPEPGTPIPPEPIPNQ